MTASSHIILFVDDEPVLSLPLRLLMEAKGFKCICREDMTSAWDYIQKNPVSVLVTDVMMPPGPGFPGIDSSETGFHFVSMVRSKKRGIGVVCLSVIGDQAKIQQLKSQGVLYLRKGETPLERAASIIESKATGLITFKRKYERPSR